MECPECEGIGSLDADEPTLCEECGGTDPECVYCDEGVIFEEEGCPVCDTSGFICNECECPISRSQEEVSGGVCETCSVK